MKRYIFITSEGGTTTPMADDVENEQVLSYIEAQTPEEAADRFKDEFLACYEHGGYVPRNVKCYEVSAKFNLTDDFNLEPAPGE